MVSAVTSNDVISVGPHRFLCADIENRPWPALFGALPKTPYMVYSDPPWSGPNARYWRTHARVDGRVGRSVDYGHFMRCFFECIRESGARQIFVEASVHHWESVASMAAIFLPPLQGGWTVYYGPRAKPLPNKLLYFADADTFRGDPSAMHGEAVTRNVFECMARPGEIVLDPCVGKGMTARMANRFGMICCGIELNAARLTHTLKWLEGQS